MAGRKAVSFRPTKSSNQRPVADEITGVRLGELITGHVTSEAGRRGVLGPVFGDKPVDQ
jgi:hypothetical protein